MKKKQKNKRARKSVVKEVKKDSNENQIKWIIFVMIALIFVIILVYFIAQESNKFSYGGLQYEKIDSRNIALYQTKISIKDIGGNVVANYNLYLRNDPRDLKDIILNSPIQINTGTIVSLDKYSEVGCDDAGIAGANFFGFLRTAGIKLSVAYSEEDYAKEKNANYVTCETNSSQSIIMIKKGDENRITEEREDCFVLEFKDCEILKTTERFMVALYANSKGIQV